MWGKIPGKERAWNVQGREGEKPIRGDVTRSITDERQGLNPTGDSDWPYRQLPTPAVRNFHRELQLSSIFRAVYAS